jgi:predicted acylesterase/phospholipase RssA
MLPARGAEYIVGVDVVSSLPQWSPRFARRRAGRLAALVRVHELQDRLVSQAQTRQADLLLRPDTSAFDWADFTRSRELAAQGAAAAEESLQALRAGLNAAGVWV